MAISGENITTADGHGNVKTELLTVAECQKYLERFDLSSGQVLALRNTVIGVVNKSLNAYLEDYKDDD